MSIIVASVLGVMGVTAVLSRGLESLGGMLYILSDCIILCGASGT